MSLAEAALGNLRRRGVRTLVIVLTLVAILLPAVIALAVAEGLRYQAEVSLRAGADLTICREVCGESSAVDRGLIPALAAVDGISDAAPRVVGRTYFVDRVISVVGLPANRLARLRPLIDGEAPAAPGDVLVGHGLAREFGVKLGLRFTLAANNKIVLRAVGLIKPAGLWGSHVLLMSIPDANRFFRVTDKVSHALVWTSSDAAPHVKTALVDMGETTGPGGNRWIVTSKRQSAAAVDRAYDADRGVFTVLAIVAFGLTVPAVLVTSGLGLGDLVREVGVLKATGWRSVDILEIMLIESLAMSLTAVSLAVILTLGWLKGLNGLLIAQFFVSEVGLTSSVSIPCRIPPAHAAAALGFAMILTAGGASITMLRTSFSHPSNLMR